MACAICEIRRPKRSCPGIQADICTTCCGNEREVSVNCPLDCEYLREARRHERPAPFDAAHLPNADIKVSEHFLEQNRDLLTFLGETLTRAAVNTPAIVDPDCREAFDALVRTFRTLQSGVYYDTLPQTPVAAGLYQLLRQGIQEFRDQERQSLGAARTRDTDVLGMLVFLQRLELSQSNGRPRGRAFLGSLVEFYWQAVTAAPASPPSSLILP